MTEYELLKKIREVNRLLEDYQKGKITKESLNWSKEIKEETRTYAEKYFQTQTSGTRCPSCNGTGTI